MPVPFLDISSLPREIILHIFAFIPPQDLAINAVKVSKLFWELGLDPILWKRFCEREYGISDTGNVFPPNDWQREYFVMSIDWAAITGNTLRLDVKYENAARLVLDEEGCVVFTNTRPRANQNPAPITSQSTSPLRPLPLGDFSVGYYEIRLEDAGEEQMIGLGLARNNYLDAMPGWKKGSIGYHGDDGRVFIGCGFGRTLTEPWSKMDIFGCGVDFRRKYVFFTKNGSLLGTYPLRRAEGLYPTIGSRTEGESVTVNFGQKPFVFDLLNYQRLMTDCAPPPPGSLAIPYSKLVYRCKPVNNVCGTPLPYDEDDDVEDEDNEFDDKGMNKASQYFNSVLRVLMNSDDYPNDDGSVAGLVSVLRGQMQDSGLTLPPDMEMSEMRQALSNQIQFNKQSAILAYFLRVYEDGKFAVNLDDNLLPKDEFPKNEIIRCIATLLLDDYRDDHPLVLNTINRGRILFNFQPPAGMTIMQERGQLSLVLSREIQAHERERRAKRREIFKSLRAQESTFYYYNETPLRDYSILLDETNLDSILTNRDENNNNNNNNTNNSNNNNNNNNISNISNSNNTNNNNNINTNNNNNSNTTNNNNTFNNNSTENNSANNYTANDDIMTEEYDDVAASIADELHENLQTLNHMLANAPPFPPAPTDENNNNSASSSSSGNTNNVNVTNNDEQLSLSPQQFQDMLKAYVDLLNDRTIPDEDPRITGAICQWYTTLDIDMKPEMQVSVERNRLVKVLMHLCTKVDEHIEDHNATSFFSRMGLKMRRFCRNITKSFSRDSAVRVSFFMVLGCLIVSTFQRKKN